MKPTDEQVAILDEFATGFGIVIEAAAGAGKTTILRMIAQHHPRRRGLYVAYNKPIQLDAAASFPSNVECRTAHSLAYGAIAPRYQRAGRKIGGGYVSAQQAAKILGVREPIRYANDRAPLAPQSIARIVVAALEAFAKSDDNEPGPQHLAVTGVPDTVRRELVPFLNRAYLDIQSSTGQLRLTLNMVLKLFQLTRPRLPFDMITVDEAQDLNPCVASLMADQPYAQVVYVGDRNQAINGWNGAIDAMENAPGERFQLTQSFRFGEAIAEVANDWLERLGAEMRVRGTPSIRSTVGPSDQPTAVLCRTNAGTLGRVMALAAAGRKVGLVGKVAEDLSRLAKAAINLQANEGTDHPDLLAFRSWREVQVFAAEDKTAGDLNTLVKLVDGYGPHGILATVDSLCTEEQAEIVASTAHRSKGREWSSVLVADDFFEPPAGEPLDPEYGRLAYVTVTRAKEHLAPGSLGLGFAGPSFLEERAPARVAAVPVLAWTADPCPGCGYLPDENGECGTCQLAGAVVPDGLSAPYAAGTRVRYQGATSGTVYTVRSSWPSLGVGWIYAIEEPGGNLQRGIPEGRLELATTPVDQVPTPTADELLAAYPWAADDTAVVAPVADHCRRCGSPRCICGGTEKRRYMALASATSADAVAAAVDAYLVAVGRG